MGWDLQVGDEDTRTMLQERHRGSRSRGISAPARTSGLKDIMLWWRPDRGEAFGYVDGWTPSGDAFYFSGLGQQGDQGFDAPYQENGRIRDHAAAGDCVRLLRYVASNTVRYLGELRLDAANPWQWRDGPDRVGGVRKIIQFRFLPVGRVLRDPTDPVHETPSSKPTRVEVDARPMSPPTRTELEALNSATFRQAIVAQEVLAHRRELELVHGFRDWLRTEHGVEASGLRIPYAPEARDLRADLFVTGPPALLIEAKASASRFHIRLAVGQLFDYRRWLDPRPGLCVLLPTQPAPDMLDLLGELKVGAIWTSGASFELVPSDLL